METQRQKLKREINNIWYEIKFDIQLPIFAFITVTIGWFIYTEFFTKSDYTIIEIILDSLKMGLFISVGIIVTGLAFQLMSALTGSSFSYRGTVVSRPDDIGKSVPRVKLYLQIVSKIFSYLKS